MTPRTVGLFVAAALATGWLLGSTTSQEPSSAARSPRGSGPRPLGGATPSTPYTEKLHERMKQQPPLPERGRNPFTFGSRSAPLRPSRAARPGRDVEVPPMPTQPPPPAFRLTGIASSQENGVAVLTAIVIDNGVMIFVKQGDMLSGGNRVIRLDEMSITLQDAAGVTQTLRLP